MAELPFNDCAIPQSLPPLNNLGIPIALCHQDWTSIQTNLTHPLYTQVHSWPISHLLGLIPCRLEHEWIDELTSSGDLLYLGAVPKALTKIIEKFCREALDNCRRNEDRTRIKHLSQSIKAKWKEIQLLLRLKPQAIQRVISAQLGVYEKELHKRQRAESESIDASMTLDMTTGTEDQSTHSEAELVATSPSEGDDCFIIRPP